MPPPRQCQEKSGFLSGFFEKEDACAAADRAGKEKNGQIAFGRRFGGKSTDFAGWFRCYPFAGFDARLLPGRSRLAEDQRRAGVCPEDVCRAVRWPFRQAFMPHGCFAPPCSSREPSIPAISVRAVCQRMQKKKKRRRGIPAAGHAGHICRKYVFLPPRICTRSCLRRPACNQNACRAQPKRVR